MGYVVNEDKPTNSALVHDETCEHYSDRLPKAPQDGGWHGPYESEDEALAKARATGRSDVRVAKCCLAEPGILDRAKGAIGSVTQRARRSAEVISGADIRRFEEFTDATTTAVIGVHRDQAELRERLAVAEQSLEDLQQRQAKVAESLTRWVIVFGTVAAVALLASIVAVVMALT